MNGRRPGFGWAAFLALVAIAFVVWLHFRATHSSSTPFGF
jgi:hypothetical protein